MLLINDYAVILVTDCWHVFVFEAIRISLLCFIPVAMVLSLVFVLFQVAPPCQQIRRGMVCYTV